MREKYFDKPLWLLHSIAVHSWPLIANIINLCLTDIVFKPSHIMLLFPISIGYSLHNYMSVMRNGEPVYWFLTWDGSGTSTIIVTSLTTGCAVFFLLMSWLTRKLKSIRPKVPVQKAEPRTKND